MTKKMAQALIIGLQMSVCGLICFSVSQYFDFKEGFWAVVTVSAITRAYFSATFIKAGLRLIGTLCGAGVGFLIAEGLGYSLYELFFVVLLFTSITVYISLQTKPYNYLSIVAGFSSVIVIASFLLGNIKMIALYRTLEVCFGIIVMAIVSWLMAKCSPSRVHLIDQDAPRKIYQSYRAIHFSKIDLINTLVISLTACLTFLSWMILRYPQGVWVTITLFVIMEDSAKGTNEKALARFLGQVFAAVLGGAVALLFPTNLLVIGLVLGVGFFICGMVIGYEAKFTASGNHAGSALAIMLLAGLPGNGIEVVLGRFFNVLAGIIIAIVVSYLQFREK